jgi:hypothetical protein
VRVRVARVMRRARLLPHVAHTSLAFLLYSEHALLAFYSTVAQLLRRARLLPHVTHTLEHALLAFYYSTVARVTRRALACRRMLAYLTCFFTLLRACFTCVLLHCGSSDAACARLPHVSANLRTWQYTLLKRHVRVLRYASLVLSAIY